MKIGVIGPLGSYKEEFKKLREFGISVCQFNAWDSSETLTEELAHDVKAEAEKQAMIDSFYMLSDADKADVLNNIEVGKVYGADLPHHAPFVDPKIYPPQMHPRQRRPRKSRYGVASGGSAEVLHQRRIF